MVVKYNHSLSAAVNDQRMTALMHKFHELTCPGEKVIVKATTWGLSQNITLWYKNWELFHGEQKNLQLAIANPLLPIPIKI